MQKIRTRGKEIEAPSTLEELTPEQYKLQLMMAAAIPAGLYTVEEYRRAMLGALAGVPGGDYTLLLPEYVAELDAQAEAATAGLLEEYKGELRPRLKTCRNLLPEVDGHRGPGDWLEGVTWGEFTEAATALEISTQDESAAEDELAHVARVLYHYEPEEEVPTLLKHHAGLYLTNVLGTIATEPTIINGKEIDLGIIFRAEGNGRRRGPDDMTGWTGVTYEVASSGVFGNLKETEGADLWEVLLYLYRCKFDMMHQPSK